MIIQSSKENLFRTISGRLIKDPEFSQFGERNYSKASIALACEGKKGSITTIRAMFDLADACKLLQKNDWIIATGILTSYEGKDGQRRWYLEAETIVPDIRVLSRLGSSTDAPIDISGFTELPDDDLPFD